MKQNNPTKIFRALEVAGQIGCLVGICVVGAVFFGLWFDRTFGTGKLATLLCLVASIPVNMFITLRVTQRLIRRIIPPETANSEGYSPNKNDGH